MVKDIAVDVSGINAEVIDHSEEFIAIIHQSVLGVYQSLLDSDRIRQLLAGDNNFNHGKVYAYAEYLVFRTEFGRRFPEASAAKCVNSFSGLLLKNDISISSLVEFLEQSVTPEIEMLAKKTSIE